MGLPPPGAVVIGEQERFGVPARIPNPAGPIAPRRGDNRVFLREEQRPARPDKPRQHPHEGRKIRNVVERERTVDKVKPLPQPSGPADVHPPVDDLRVRIFAARNLEHPL